MAEFFSVTSVYSVAKKILKDLKNIDKCDIIKKCYHNK